MGDTRASSIRAGIMQTESMLGLMAAPGMIRMENTLEISQIYLKVINLEWF